MAYNKGNTEITYEIEEQIGVLGEPSESGWQKEVNIVSFNGGRGMIDIREWAPNHEKMGKGIRLRNDEAKELIDVLKEHFDL